jgi:hypothetical protein
MRSACATAFSESRPLLLRPPDTILAAKFAVLLVLGTRLLQGEGLALTRLKRDECIAAAKARRFRSHKRKMSNRTAITPSSAIHPSTDQTALDICSGGQPFWL